MNSIFNLSRVVVVALCGLTLVACDTVKNVSEEDFAALPPQQVLLNGTISGLGNSPVVLQNNGAGNRSFSTTSLLTMGSVPVGSNYNITVLTQPQNRTCTVVNGSGTISAAVSNVQVNCVVNPGVSVYTVSGTISGGAVGVPGLRLSLSTIDGTETISPSVTATSFAFVLPLLNLTNYTVTATYPGTGGVTNNCGVVNGAGTVAAANVTTVNVNTCKFTIGGAVATLALGPGPALASPGVTLALRDMSGNQLETVNVATAGAYQFLTTRVSNAQASYVVAVTGQPTGQTCLVANAGSASLVTAGNVNLAVNCIAAPIPANQIAGTYKTGRTYWTFFADGTFLYGVHGATAAASGVEQGFYFYNCCGPGSLYMPLQTDANGTAGLSGMPGSFFGTPFATAVTKSAGPSATISASFGTTVVNMTAVTSTAGQLTGAWATADRRHVFVYNAADETGFYMGVNGAGNLQDVCLLIDNPVATSGNYVQDRNAQCRPAGLAVMDTAPLGFTGGLPGAPPSPQRASEPTNYTVTAAATDTLSLQATFDGAAVGSPMAFTRSTPN